MEQKFCLKAEPKTGSLSPRIIEAIQSVGPEKGYSDVRGQIEIPLQIEFDRVVREIEAIEKMVSAMYGFGFKVGTGTHFVFTDPDGEKIELEIIGTKVVAERQWGGVILIFIYERL